MFVHIDDCHMHGKRRLRRFEEIEFTLAKDPSTGKSKAMHVCGPNRSVLRYCTDNQYIPRDLANNRLPKGTDTIFSGFVSGAPRDKLFYIIKPNNRATENVLANYRSVKVWFFKNIVVFCFFLCVFDI